MLDDRIQALIDARNMIRDVRISETENSLTHKALVAAEKAIEIAWDLVEKEAAVGDDPCPEGCGGATSDPYGGPCSKCWDAVQDSVLP